jgi:HprK-related kinase B
LTLRPLLLRFGEVVVAVNAEDDRLRDRLSSYFRGFVASDGVAPKPDVKIDASLERRSDVASIEFAAWDARGKDSYADVLGKRFIRKDRTGVLISAKKRHWTIEGDLSRNFSQLVNLVGTAYSLTVLDRGGAMLHASAVARDGLSLALIGTSGSGKSSTAVRLLELGFDFLSNDRLILEAASKAVLAHGVPKLPRVNPGTLLSGRRTRALLDSSKRQRYQKLPPEQLRAVEDKYDLDVAEILGSRWELTSQLGCAIVLAWTPSGRGLSFQRLDADQALEAMRATAKSFGAFDRRLSERRDDALLLAARRVPVYRVSGQFNPSQLAREISWYWPDLAQMLRESKSA